MSHRGPLHSDAVILGEAEGVWPLLLHDLKSGNLAPYYDARGVSFDLSLSPMPRFELLDIERYNRLTVQTQRGCPFSCDFCASSIRLSPRFKTKPIARVISEIRRIKEIWPQPFIELADDNTFASKAHGKRLARAIAGEHLRWFTETDISVADDAELLEMLRDAGCVQLLIGLEAPDRDSLEGIEAQANWKAGRANRYLESIERIQSHGISVNGCFVLGLDAQDDGCFARVARFVKESGLHEVQVTLPTPFPGTPLYQRLKDQGRLLDDTPWERCTLFDVTFVPKRMTVAELEMGFSKLIAELYGDEAIRARRSRLRRQWRGSRLGVKV